MADYLHNSIPGLRYGQKILPSEIIGYDGYIFGNTYYVDATNGSDSNPGTTSDKAYATVAEAYDNMTTNNHDVVYISGYAEHTLTSMLSVSKNRCHFIGADFDGRRYGQSTRISLTATSGATNIATLQNTGVRNSFKNIKFSNASTVDEGIYCVADGGEYTVIDSCEMYKSTDLDITGAAEFLCNGDAGQYRNCYIGSTVNAISGAILRPCVLLTRETITGKVARDITFEDTIFARKCGNTGNRFVYGANATDVERLGLFDSCIFWNAALAAAVPAQNVAFGASLTDGAVLLRNCSAMNAATAMSTTTGVFVDGAAPTAATSGIAVQAS